MQEQIKQRIDQVISNLSQLPSMPDVVTKVINMVNDPNVDFKVVATEISKDQAITTNILKLCNSAYFSKGKEIVSLDRAIVTLGLKEVKDIVVLAAVKQVLDKPIMGYDLAAGELWKHNLAVAMLSKRIALDRKLRDVVDVAFTGGIIHDVGKTVLALYVASAFKEIMNTVQTKNIPFSEAEVEVMGYSHQEIGTKILEKWMFPEVLRSIVQFHHNPEAAPKEHRLPVSIVHIANTICLMAGIGIGGDGLFHEMSPEAVKLVGVTDADLEKYFSTTPELLNQMKQLAF